MAIFAGAAGASAAGSAAATAGAGTAAASTATIGYTTAAGTSAATIASYAATAAMMLSAVRSGQAQEVGMKVQAEKVRADAQTLEVNRRKRLVASLASQNATRAASGIAYLEGSSRDMSLEDIRAGEGSMLVDRAGSDYYGSQLETQGGYARSTGYLSAGASLLDQVDRTMQRG